MELWYVHAILSGIFAGLYSLLLKISAEKNHNPPLVIAYSMISCAVIALFVLVASKAIIISVFVLVLVALLNGSMYFIGTATRIESLKNIDSTIYFPLYKTLGPILTLFIARFFFLDIMTLKETIGFALGIIVPLLLLTKKEKHRQKNLYVGLMFLLVSTGFVAVSSALSKVAILYQLNVTAYVGLSFFLGGILAFIIYRKNPKNKHSDVHVKRIGIANGIFLFLSGYFFVNATIGNLAVVYTINSFSILIPIVASVFLYKEHFNTRKALAVVLTVAALWFFQ